MISPLNFSKRAKIAINLGLEMVRVLCCVIIKVIRATTRTRVASLSLLIHVCLDPLSLKSFLKLLCP